HASAKKIQIRLQSDAECINLIISDDGKGFNISAVVKGAGLNNIVNRTELFNGNAEISSAPDKGCTVTITVPLVNNPTEL
ncbi:MAG: histidine kinase, partial [Bacteroidetes bacterium]